MGKLMGTMHDGKMTHAYQDYLLAVFQGESVRRGSVNHTFAPVRYLLKRYHAPDTNGYAALTAELAAYAIGAHHGVFDCNAVNGANGFDHRLNWQSTLYDEHMDNFFHLYRSKAEIDSLFQAAVKEVTALKERFSSFQDQLSQDFSFGALARLLLSALIEGDRTDTAIFMHGGIAPTERTVLWTASLRALDAYLRKLPPSPNAALDDALRNISEICRKQGESASRLFRLNVPTGAGKTLSALRFALTQCECQGKKRIFFVMPLLSIIDQNVKVIKSALGRTVEVLEHHSNVVVPKQDTDELDLRELLCENWRAPVVCTTLFQFLNTLFSEKTTCIRRFQALCESVIVLDEVQSVPIYMLSPFNMMINFLTEVCGATVVLCSATQPVKVSVPHPLLHAVDMVPCDPKRFEIFRRTEILPPPRDPMTMAEIAVWCQAQLTQIDTIAVVCNTRAEASELFGRLREVGTPCVHLSASMCMAHRQQVLVRIQCLPPGEKLVCVSTQVFETGVDISLQRIGRILTGLDQIVQAAGRCNRHGENCNQLGQVQILSLKGERLPAALQTIKDGQTATNFVLNHYSKAPARFNDRLDSDAAILDYYQMLFDGLKPDAMDYPLAHCGTMLELLSTNNSFTPEEDGLRYYLHQAFLEVGQRFRVFGEDMIDLVVPYQKGGALLEKLRKMDLSRSIVCAENLVRSLRPFTVSVYREQLQMLKALDAIEIINPETLSVLALRPAFYDSMVGLTLSPKENEGRYEFASSKHSDF